jgi:hypothetical protein
LHNGTGVMKKTYEIQMGRDDCLLDKGTFLHNGAWVMKATNIIQSKKELKGNLSIRKQVYLSSNEVAQRWSIHRTSVARICQRYGYSGLKFGSSSCARRFKEEDIEKIEALANFNRKEVCNERTH